MLNPSQQQAVEHGEGPLLILAGAGAGKTHTLTERIAYLVERRGVAPGAILAVTFTNKAAKEMRERMAKRLGFSMEHYSPYRSRGLPLMGTFHSICLVFIREYPYLVGLSPNFSLYDEDDKTRIIREITKSDGASGDSVNIREILSTISRAKNSLESPDDFMTKANSYKSRDIAEIYAEYEKRLRASDAVDFDDILLLGLKVLQNPEARDRIAGRFDYVFVDEYQDTNDAQYKIVRILAERHRNLCVVGDDWQGIYSWRGANIKNILSFQKDFPDASVVKLEQNYRSTKTIISAANAVIKHNTENLEKTLWTENPEGSKIHVVDAGNEREEARYIAERISEAGSPGEWAVLYRTNSQSRAIEEALVRSNIPYRIFGGVKFYERKEVKDMLAYMRLVANPHDRASLLRVINVPARKLGAKSVETILEYLENYSVDVLSLVEMLDEIDGLGAAAREGFRQFASVLSRARARMQDESVANVMK
jgi:DNA helicase II / ATP-dependent DNA helicase PcrA